MSFSGWLRTNSQHYLMIAAHERVAKAHGVTPPRSPRGLKEIFWLRIFAPVYHALPWPLRHRVLKAMPGSHRKTWAPPPRSQGPAV
jgi:hypothetical protein